MQLVCIVLAFAAMAVLSYHFIGRIGNENPEEYAPGVLYKSIAYRGWILCALGVLLAEVLSIILIRLNSAKTKSDLESKFKSSFLTNMSHEIRTPMSAILGITEIQLENKLIPADTVEALGKIYNSADQLLGIINDILDLSRIEAGKLELSPVKYDVASLLSDTVQLNRMCFESKPVNFLFQVNENVPAVLFGDDLRLKQILNNVLSNAFKYTEKGEVELSVDVENNAKSKQLHNPPEVTLIFRIRDTGQGMTAEQVSCLFDRYARYSADAGFAAGGTGLGVSIVWNLVRMMKGNISVESMLNKGTVVTIAIRQGYISDSVLGAQAADNLRQFKMDFAPQKKRAQVVREPMPYGKVLVVDDTESNIYLTKGLLVHYGMHIETVNSGFGAIEKIKSGCRYDIIFMDHMMPMMDGMEAAKIIRTMGYTNAIVAMTANFAAGQAEIFLANGFDAFISKPIDIRRLNSLLNTLIRDKQPPEVIKNARDQYGFLQHGSTNLSAYEDFQLVKSFIRDADRTVATLEALLKSGRMDEEENLNIFITNVHAMKSVLGIIGKTELSETARRMEQAGRVQDLLAIEVNTPVFVNELKKVLRNYKAIEADEGSQASGSVSAPDDGSLAAAAAAQQCGPDAQQHSLREKLLAIKAACTEYDIITAEAMLTVLQQTSYPNETSELLENISGLLLHSEFEEAADAIDYYFKVRSCSETEVSEQH